MEHIYPIELHLQLISRQSWALKINKKFNALHLCQVWCSVRKIYALDKYQAESTSIRDLKQQADAAPDQQPADRQANGNALE